MTEPHDSIRVVIPLTVRKRNGRTKILPLEGTHCQEARSQGPHILKALGRAWTWRRRLERGEASTVSDIAKDENVTDRYVSRTIRLTYLSPEVVELLVLGRAPPAISVAELIDATCQPWPRQAERVFTS